VEGVRVDPAGPSGTFILCQLRSRPMSAPLSDDLTECLWDLVCEWWVACLAVCGASRQAPVKMSPGWAVSVRTGNRYGLPAPSLVHFRGFTTTKFEDLWRSLWFAKGPLQAPLDARLRLRFGDLLQGLDGEAVSEPRAGSGSTATDGAGDAPYPGPALRVPPPGGAVTTPDLHLLWNVGWLIAWDQLPRNVHRGTGWAYAFWVTLVAFEKPNSKYI
jgi:hypothetical protein